MLSSITPLGERGRQHQWSLTVAIYIMAAGLGGAAVGVTTALVGRLILGSAQTGWRLGVVAAALVLGFGWELSGRGVPGPRRQVDERWLVRYRRWVYAGGYGVQLGPGITTIVVSSSVYVIWLASFISGDPLAGALIGAAAGVMRGASLLTAGRVNSPARLISFHRRMAAREQPARRLALAAQLVLAVLTLLAAGLL